jgi:hypothetical protein
LAFSRKLAAFSETSSAEGGVGVVERFLLSLAVRCLTPAGEDMLYQSGADVSMERQVAVRKLQKTHPTQDPKEKMS